MLTVKDAAAGLNSSTAAFLKESSGRAQRLHLTLPCTKILSESPTFRWPHWSTVLRLTPSCRFNPSKACTVTQVAVGAVPLFRRSVPGDYPKPRTCRRELCQVQQPLRLPLSCCIVSMCLPCLDSVTWAERIARYKRYNRRDRVPAGWEGVEAILRQFHILAAA